MSRTIPCTPVARRLSDVPEILTVSRSYQTRTRTHTHTRARAPMHVIPMGALAT
jgi:hypothetical protein